MAQLIARSLPIPEDPGLNPVIDQEWSKDYLDESGADSVCFTVRVNTVLC